MLEPVDGDDIQETDNNDGEDGARWRNRIPCTICLGCTRLELLTVFVHEPQWRRRTIDLDRLLSTTSESSERRLTFVNVLNYLMDLKVL